MDVLVCLACGMLAGLSVRLLLFGVEADKVATRTRAAARVLRRVFERLAGSRVVERLLRTDVMGEIAREVERGASEGLCETPEEAAALVLALLLGIALAGGFLARSPLGSVVLVTLALVGSRLHLSSAKQKTSQALAEEMPSVLRTLATALESGNTLVQAIEYVGVHERGPAAEAFAHASLAMRCGLSVDETLERLEAELDAPGVGLMSTALSISQRTGSPLRELFQRSALLVERDHELKRTLSVRTAQVRLSVRVVCGLPVLLVSFLSLISPDYRAGLATGLGMGCLMVAILLDGVALAIIHRTLEGVM